MAVIRRTVKYSFENMNFLQGILLFFVFCGVASSQATRSCESARKGIEEKLKVQPIKIPEVPQIGDLCGESCCTVDLERDAYKFNQLFVDKYLKNSISKISSIIETRARKFDDQFQGMMKISKKEFHEMFQRTYGKIYLKNSDVFSDFFDELETYYKKGSVRLSETMDTFFGILYQRMFTVINAQYTFDDTYLDCVSSHMQEMKPFGDVPHKLGVQLRRSFVATRTFFKSLMKAAEAAERFGELKVGEECYRESAKMRYCGVCKGEDGGVPCSMYCIATMQNCLRYHTEVSSYWDNLIDAIDKVGERLLGPYNIEIVVEPLNIKISEAIMNFQESGTEVSKKIYSLCGKPTFSRPKREADYKDPTPDNPTMEIKIEPMKIPGRKKHKKTMTSVENQSTPLEKIIIDIKQKIKETKQFWLNLPYQYCNNLSILNSINSTSSVQCWNGTSPNISSAKIQPGDHPILSEQTYVLQGLTDKLRKAHQGQEVEMVDDTEEILDGSGSGSGDGLEEEEKEGEERKVEGNEEDKDITFVDPKVKQPPRKRFKANPRYLGDVSTTDMDNPEVCKKVFKISKKKILVQRKTIHSLRMSNKRLKQKITDLNSLIQHLREKQNLTEKAETSIKASVPENCKAIIENLLKGPSKQKYSPEIREFVLTLNFYSTKAYEYLRETFKMEIDELLMAR